MEFKDFSRTLPKIQELFKTVRTLKVCGVGISISTASNSVTLSGWLPLSGLPWIPACSACCLYLAW